MKSSKTLLLIIIIFILSFGYVQNGYAYYKKQLLSNGDDLTNHYKNKDVRQLNDIEYELTFNKSNALFKRTEMLIMERNPVVEVFTEAISGFTGEGYFNKIKNEIIHKTEFSGSTFLIKKKPTN